MKNGCIQRESFILYKSFYNPISQLTDEQLGRLFRSIYLWQINGEADPEPDIKVAFGFFINQFRIDNEKYSAKCEQYRENGRMGGRPKKTNRLSENQSVSKKAKKADNDNENDNVNDNEKSSLTLPFADQEFIDTWNELRKQPKWRKKTVTALKKSLDRLSRYDVRFAIELMNTAIENGYQGVVYDDTPSRYEQWMRSHPQPQSGKAGDMNRDNYSAYDFD